MIEACEAVDQAHGNVAIAAAIYDTTCQMIAGAPEPIGWPEVVVSLRAFLEQEAAPVAGIANTKGLAAAFILAWASRAALLRLEAALLSAPDLPPVVLDPEFVQLIWRGVILHYQETCASLGAALLAHGWKPGDRSH